MPDARRMVGIALIVVVVLLVTRLWFLLGPWLFIVGMWFLWWMISGGWRSIHRLVTGQERDVRLDTANNAPLATSHLPYAERVGTVPAKQTHAPSSRRGFPGNLHARANEQDRSGSALVKQIRHAAKQIPNREVRREVDAVAALADHILSALADGHGDTTTGDRFIDRYLSPASAIVDRYARLASRQISTAEPALSRVEDHDLPLLRRRFAEFYEHLHRGDLIELEAASEMLAFDLATDSVPDVRQPVIKRSSD